MVSTMLELADELAEFGAGRRFGTILADPPWQFTNRTGKMAPTPAVTIVGVG